MCPIPYATGLLCLLVLAGCDRETGRENPSRPPLLSAAEQGDLPGLESLLTDSTDLDVRDQCRWTPLMKAALNGHANVVRRLLEAGAQVDAADKGGYSALMLAASNNHPAVVRLLAEYGGDLNRAEPGLAWTALIWAAKLGHQATVAVLLDLGADVSMTDREGNTAADWARRNGHLRVLGLFYSEPEFPRS